MDGCSAKKILISENCVTDWDRNTDMQSAAREDQQHCSALIQPMLHILAKISSNFYILMAEIWK